jgi:hypothetical protein
MTQLNTTISALLVRYANDEASPEEKCQLDAWASRSAANRLWLEQFADLNWLQKQSAVHHTIDLEERSQTFWSMVDAHETQHIQQTVPGSQPGKLKYMPTLQWMATAAAIIILFSAAAYLFLTPNNKINPTAGLFNKTKATSPVANSTPQPPVSGTRPINKKMKPKSPVIVSTSPQSADTIKTIYSTRTLAPDKPTYSYAGNGGTANEPKSNNLWIPPKGFSIIDLPDGSRAWVNAMTHFSHPLAFTGDKRIVEVTGEAYFEVMPNDSLPFLVAVNGVELETTGGRFNVNAYENEPAKKITVLQGTVTVATGPHTALIPENQAALVTKNITVEQNADTLRAIAWKDGQFLYKQDNGSIVMREVARRYDLTITGHIHPHTLISYSGAWTETAEETLAAIQRDNNHFHYKITGKKLILE